MPTVLLLDLSLSMAQPIGIEDPNSDEITKLDLAIQGIGTFLDNLSTTSKLEFVALITFSSLFEVMCGFTRDYDLIKSKLQTLEEYDKTYVEAALHATNNLVLEEWGNNVPCQVLLITDGYIGVGPMSLLHSLMTANKRDLSNPFPLPFPFPGELHVACIMALDDKIAFLARSTYQKLVDLAGNNGNVIFPASDLTADSVNNMFSKFVVDVYSFKSVLKCGNLSSNIILSPPPMPHTKVTDFESKRMMLSKTIEVCGFINIADMSSPMAVSRHLILPIAELPKENQLSEPKSPTATKHDVGESQSEEESSNDEGKIPSFCVLLHGALKVENVVALVLVGEDWYGYIYSHADCKKKSNLMLTILPPGTDIVPWLGDLNNLGTVDFLDGEQPLGFPVRPTEKRSYSQNCVVWIREVGLQADIQKILRHARKLPDKTQQFYKELNRLRRAAISLGFLELLDQLAFIFERECTILPAGINPDCTLQLTHASSELRKAHNRDLKFVITPLITQFNSGPPIKNF